MLDLLVKLFQMLVQFGWELDDVEAALFLPYLCQESGQQKPRFRMRFRDVLRLVVHVYPSAKLTPYLLECITNSKNSKSRSECLDLIEFIADTKGHAAVGRKTLRDVGKYVDCAEKEVRESAIGAVVKMYTLMGDPSTDRFFTLCNITSQKAMDLVLQKVKYLPPSTTAATTTTTTAGTHRVLTMPKPTTPAYQRYASMPLDEPAREPPLSTAYEAPPPAPSMYTTTRLERPATPLKYQTTTPIPSALSAYPPGYAQPPPTTSPSIRLPLPSSSSGLKPPPTPTTYTNPPTTPASTPYRSDFGSTRTDMRTLLFVPLE
ncbi:hypothetical protein AaE_004318, partial [Aphanomyces astaci]